MMNVWSAMAEERPAREVIWDQYYKTIFAVIDLP